MGIHDVVSSKSQDTMIANAWEAFCLYRGHKRAPKLPGVHVSSVESLDRTWKTCQTLIRTWETWGTPSERDGPGGNVLASVVDRGPNRSAPWSLRDSAPFARHGYRDRPWENLARPNKTWIQRKNGQNPTAHYVSGKRGCRGRREHNVNLALAITHVVKLFTLEPTHGSVTQKVVILTYSYTVTSHALTSQIRPQHTITTQVDTTKI